MPRPPTLSTTSSVLRSIIGTTAEQMAKFLKCSVSTVKSVESGRLKLSPSLAARMHAETGISINWLLAGDPKTPPITDTGAPFTIAEFVRFVGTEVINPAGVLRSFAFGETIASLSKKFGIQTDEIESILRDAVIERHLELVQLKLENLALNG